MKKYLAAVSGGPDSMALLYKYHHNIVGVCHVNYNKRETSKRDEFFTKQMCKILNIRCYCLNVTQKTYSKYSSHNFQNVARQIRYDFFAKIAKKTKCNNILIAHNLDDFAETAYMQESRMSNTLFFGIKKNNEYKGLNISRPLINIRKKDLEKYCIKNNIPYGIDESNLSDIYERNKVRKTISKWSDKKFNDYIKKIHSKNSKNKVLEQKVLNAYKVWSIDHSLQYFNKLDKNIQFHLIYQFLNENEIYSCSKSKINNILLFIKNGKPHSKYRVGCGKFIIKNKNNINI